MRINFGLILTGGDGVVGMLLFYAQKCINRDIIPHL